MADELTISEAVERYEVSRKTVRRRLAEGAIDDARQRPGDHGPEWIFPAASLEALGYRLRRDGSAPVVGPVATEQEFDTEPAPRRSAAVWVVLALIFGPLLGFLLANVMSGDEPDDSPPLLAVLDELTRPGDRIGVVRPLTTDLPSGRVPVSLEPADLSDLGDGVRYIVVGDDADEALTMLQSSARLVLALEPVDDPRWVFDTQQAPVPVGVTSAVPPATDDVDPPTTEPPATTVTSAAPANTVAPSTSTPPTTTDPAPPVEGDPDDPPAVDPSDPTPGTTVRGEVTVESGASFWSIAEDVVAESLGSTPTDAQVTSYWVDLIEANADQLVEPGNPDLLLPGQVLQLPAT